MRKSTFIIIILLTVSVFTNAQTDANYLTQRFDKEYISNFDIENNYFYILRLNPAFVHYQNRLDSIEFKNIVIADAFKNKTDGLYNFYEGNKAVGASILAGGENKIKKLGTLFGFASYATYKKYNVFQNYVINLNNYLPYIVGDTVGKDDVNFKDYNVNVGFGFSRNNWHYGLGFSYKGTVASKLTDPRFSSYLSELKLNIGVLTQRKNHIYSFGLFPEFHRQNISVTNFGQFSPMYFQFYGFGEWNKRESKSYFTYARLMTIKGLSCDFTYSTVNQKYKHFTYLFNLNYAFNKVNTLEANNKNLFSSVNQYFTYNFLLKNNHNKFDLYFLLNGKNKIQKGTEYVYEHQQVSQKDNLYDDVKVASNKMYNHHLFLNAATFKFIYKFNPKNSIHFLIGINSFYSNEKYLFPNKQLLINNITPNLGIAYHTSLQKHTLFLNLKLSEQKGLNNSFDLPFVNNTIFIHQNYIPYIIQSSDNYVFSSDLTYTYSLLNNRSFGCKISLLFANQSKLSDKSYMLDYKTYKSFFTNIKLFYLF